MAHGGYGKRRVAGRPPVTGEAGRGAGPSRALGVRHYKDTDKKAKIVSLKNQIRSVERLLRKALPLEVKDVQQKRLETLKRQAEFHANAELERRLALRSRKLKFFERRKIERAIRRLERLQRAAVDNPSEDALRQAADVVQKLTQLREDLEYVRFFPKTEKYVSLFTGGDSENIVAQRNKLRSQIKVNLAAAASAGIEPEETGSEDDGVLDISEDDFFLAGSSSDDADADDEWTDKSSRPGDDRDDTSKEVVPSSPRDTPKDKEYPPRQRLSNLGKTPLQPEEDQEREGLSRGLMPPPRDRISLSSSNSGGFDCKNQLSSSEGPKMDISCPSSSHNTDQAMSGNPSPGESEDVTKTTTTTVGSCNSDAQQQPRRKRCRLKKKRK